MRAASLIGVSTWLLVAIAGCGQQRGSSSTNPFGSGATETSTPGTAADDDDDDADGADDVDFDEKLDASMATGGDSGSGCQKIDFLFIIDASGSMQDEQQNLIQSFPGFMSTITDTLEASFFHIAVTSTDNGEETGNMTSCSGDECTCSPAPLCCAVACSNASSANTCNGFQCDELPITACDSTWGAGKIWDGSGADCGFGGERRYMLHTEADLQQSFACAASVGTYGAGAEKPMLSLVHALSEELNAPGGCNAGFLRDDALLVVTVITDEEDDYNDIASPGSPGEPADWLDALIEAKGGNPESVVFLALVGDSNRADGLCEPGIDPNGGAPGAEAAPRLQAVADGLPFGVVGSVCAPDYTPFFTDAVSVIDASCEIFEPVG